MAEQGITPRSKDFSEWYLDICTRAELAEHSPVRGCMVIRPAGYAIWEKMQRALDDMFKETGHRNLYFPMLIPKSFLSKEAKHVDGFAKECAVVTHYRLKNDPHGNGVIVDPEAKLEEELILRPTSETIIWNQYRKWIQSYRDLPLLYNQWANVMRWEMRTRMFLRTSEFLWQEGHTAHASDEEAEQEARRMLDVYTRFAEDFLAIPVIPGRKTENEKFAGAKHTYTIEAMMQDGKAVQAGTSHHLGTNFAEAFDVQFQTEKGTREFVHATSWGASTRLMGALIMTHSDDRGLVVPPRVAETHVVIVPIFKTAEELQKVLAVIEENRSAWKKHFSFQIDTRDHLTPGYKFADHELRGVPVRIEIGPKDLASGQCVAVRRDKERGEEGHKTFLPLSEVATKIPELLESIQSSLYARALKRRQEMTFEISSYAELKAQIDSKPGFYTAWFDGTSADEDAIKDELAVTARCIPFDLQSDAEGKCFYTGRPTKRKVIFARSY